MPKTLAKQPAKTTKRAGNGRPENGAERALNRKKRHKPFSQMTLEELTLFGFQLAYEQHQQKLSEQTDESVHT